MYMLKEIGEPSKARQWLLDALAGDRKIMGFGHRVYKSGDSRTPTMTKWGKKVAEIKGVKVWHDIADILEKTMLDEKGIHTNLDFASAPAYYLMGFDIDLYTPIFVMARVTGWCAHVFVQTASNRLIRPLSAYMGPGQRTVRPVADR
jgi:2-methylcitrate synthase